MKVMKKQLQGLTQVEVKRRIDAGKTNHFKAKLAPATGRFLDVMSLTPLICSILLFLWP